VSTQDDPDYMVRKPEVDEALSVHQLIERHAQQKLMLPRTTAEIYENLRDFFVCVADGSVVGCGALHLWSDLAEIRSLAVDESYRNRDIGTRIVRACIEDAKRLHVREIFVLTYQPGFFERLGFHRVSKERFPHKIWNECVKCPKFPDCDEIALAIELRQ